MQLDAAIGATALLEWLHIDWVELLVVAVEPANDVSNRDDDAFKARWRADNFLDVEDPRKKNISCRKLEDHTPTKRV